MSARLYLFLWISLVSTFLMSAVGAENLTPRLSSLAEQAADTLDAISAVGDGFVAVANGESRISIMEEESPGILAISSILDLGESRREFSLAAGGRRVAVGFPGIEVRVFEKGEEGNWAEHPPIPAPSTPDTLFGMSVALVNGNLFVGAPGTRNSGGDRLGAVHLYAFESGSWTQSSTLASVNDLENSDFGRALSVIGDDLFVGDPGDDLLKMDSGTVHRYRTGSRTAVWLEQLSLPEPRSFDRFGHTLSAAAGTLMVNKEGKAIFEIFEELDGLFQHRQTLYPRKSALGAPRLAAGGGGHFVFTTRGNTISGGGTAAVYTKDSGGLWNETHQILSEEERPGHSFATGGFIFENRLTVISEPSSAGENRHYDTYDLSEVPTAGELVPVSFDRVIKTYDGRPFIPVVVTSPPGLEHCLKFYGSPDGRAPVEVGKVLAIATITQPGFQGIVRAELEIRPSTQTISVPPPTTVPLAGRSTQLAATASSGLPVAYASENPSVCSVSPSGVLTPVDVGIAKIEVTQSGGGNYTAAPSQTIQINVTRRVEELPRKVSSIKMRNAALEGQSRFQSTGAVAYDGQAFAVGERNFHQVHIHTWEAAGEWSGSQVLEPDGDAGSSGFGAALALDAGELIIGAPGAAASSGTGACYAFSRDSSGQWLQQQKLSVPSEMSPVSFGTAVARSGDTLAVGAPGGGGGVFLYEFGADGAWSFAQRLSPAGLGAEDSFGSTIALSENRLIVGVEAHGEHGAAFIYERSSSGTWGALATIRPPSPDAALRFGASVDIEGDTAVVAAPIRNGSGREEPGVIHLYTRSAPGAWNLAQELTTYPGGKTGWQDIGIDLRGDELTVAGNASDTDSPLVSVFRHDGAGVWRLAKVAEAGGNYDSNSKGISVRGGILALSDASSSLSLDQAAVLIDTRTIPILEGLNISGTETVYQPGSSQGVTLSGPAAESYLVLYNGASEKPVNAGLYRVAISEAGAPGEVLFERTLTIDKAPQRARISQSTGRIPPGGTTEITVELDSGLPIPPSLPLNPNNATISGTTVYGLRKGYATFAYSHPGNENYLPSATLYTRIAISTEQVSSVVSRFGGEDWNFGSSAAISGTTAVIGEPQGGSNAGGKAWICEELPDGSWMLGAELVPNVAPHPGTRFGHLVAVSGDTAAVASRGVSERDVSHPGMVFIFERGANGEWEQADVFETTAPNLAHGGEMEFDGRHLVVSSPDRGGSTGSVRLFHRGATGSWTAGRDIFAPTPRQSDFFGTSLALRDGLVVVGQVPGPRTGRTGKAFVYRLSPSGPSMELIGELDSEFVETHDNFGAGVGIAPGPRILVGAPLRKSENTTVVTSGAIHIYDFDSVSGTFRETMPPFVRVGDQGLGANIEITGRWMLRRFSGAGVLGVEVFEIPPSGNPVFERYVKSIELFIGGSSSVAFDTSGNRIVLGFSSDRGVAHFLKLPQSVREPVSLGQTRGQSTANGRAGSRFGTSIGLAQNLALIGAPNDDRDGEDAGAVIAYINRGTEHVPSWESLGRLPNPSGNAAELFGNSVSISGKTAVVGAPGRGGQGEVDIFSFGSDGVWEYQESLTSSSPQEGSFFGFSVVISENLIAVGAPLFSRSEDSIFDGAVHFYLRGADGNWERDGSIKTGSLGLFNGTSLDISGSRVVSGTPGRFTNRGGARVYDRGSPVTGFGEQQFSIRDANEEDFYGEEVAIGDGLIALGSAIGEVALFKETKLGDWEHDGFLPPPVGEGEFFFGQGLEIDGDRLAVGGGIRVAEVDTPAVFLYSRGASGMMVYTGTILPDAPGEAIEFGSSNALSGDTLFIGDPAYSIAAENGGTAHITTLSNGASGRSYTFESWAEAAGLAGENAGPNADPDDDGVSNFEHYADVATPTITGGTPGGLDFETPWPPADDLVHILEFSPSLGMPWVSFLESNKKGEWGGSAIFFESQVGRKLRIEIPSASRGSRGFFRMRAERR